MPSAFSSASAAFRPRRRWRRDFRQRNVRSILDIYRTWRMTDEDEIRASNDYATGFARDNRDVVYGNWLAANPTMKDFWLKEYARLKATDCGFLGFCQSQNSLRFPPSDPIWDPFYKLSIEADVPVLLMTGLTGIGQGMPGGMGVVLEDGHPRHVDLVAARFPELKILAGRPAWPWQDDMIAILLAQIKRPLRAARLVAEIFYAGPEEGNRRPAARPHSVRLGLAHPHA